MGKYKAPDLKRSGPCYLSRCSATNAVIRGAASSSDAVFNRDAARHVATNAVNRGAPSNCDAAFNRDAARHVATSGG